MLTFTALASDVDLPAQALTFTLDPGAPEGATISSDGVFTWTPAETQGPGSYPVTITVSDGSADDSETIQIAVNEVNAPPAFTSDPLAVADATEDAPYLGSLAGMAGDSDVPAQSLMFVKESGPAWLAVSADGSLSGTPSGADIGPNAFTVACPTRPTRPTQATLQITVLTKADGRARDGRPRAAARRVLRAEPRDRRGRQDQPLNDLSEAEATPGSPKSRCSRPGRATPSTACRWWISGRSSTTPASVRGSRSRTTRAAI